MGVSWSIVIPVGAHPLWAMPRPEDASRVRDLRNERGARSPAPLSVLLCACPDYEPAVAPTFAQVASPAVTWPPVTVESAASLVREPKPVASPPM
jgi:hypothetical protein